MRTYKSRISSKPFLMRLIRPFKFMMKRRRCALYSVKIYRLVDTSELIHRTTITKIRMTSLVENSFKKIFKLVTRTRLKACPPMIQIASAWPQTKSIPRLGHLTALSTKTLALLSQLRSSNFKIKSTSNKRLHSDIKNRGWLRFSNQWSKKPTKARAW